MQQVTLNPAAKEIPGSSSGRSVVRNVSSLIQLTADFQPYKQHICKPTGGHSVYIYILTSFQ